MILDELLAGVPPALFLEQYYLKLPFSRPGGCARLATAAAWPLVEAVLQSPGVDVLAARQDMVRQGEPLTPADASALLAEGCTLRIRKAERHHPTLAALADDFRRALGGPVEIQVFCTPANQPGFGWHYDAEEVFLLQTAGSKQWLLRKNTVNPWPLPETMPLDMRYHREIMPLLQCDLHAGDWLYIPAGYWHSARAGEESISLSVGVLSTPALAVYDFLRGRLLDSLLWRQRLPAAGEASPLSDAELLGRYKELFAQLGEDLARLLAQEQTARDFLASAAGGMAPPPGR